MSKRFGAIKKAVPRFHIPLVLKFSNLIAGWGSGTIVRVSGPKTSDFYYFMSYVVY